MAMGIVMGFGCGVVFRLKPNTDGTWTKSVLYSFKGGTDGAEPTASVIFDQAGNLYGTTHSGGIRGGCNNRGKGCGTLFELTRNADGSWSEKVIHRFGKGGVLPFGNGGLILDQAGNLFGTTGSGGAHRLGVVFRLTPNTDGTWTYKVLHSFNGTDGAGPDPGLVFDAAGKLYGTTGGGGAHGGGTVFKLTPNANGTWSEKVLHSFTVLHRYMEPNGSLIFDTTGNLYGTTVFGGGHGQVFEVTP